MSFDGIIGQNKVGIRPLFRIPAFFYYRGEVAQKIEEPIVLTSYIIPIMKKRTYLVLRIMTSIRVEVVRLIKVRAYKRIRFGKVEKVRSHYRKV